MKIKFNPNPGEDMSNDDPRDKIDNLIREKEVVKKKKLYTSDMEQVRDNLKFAREVQEVPVITEDFDENVFGETVNVNPYIEQQAWPSSFYFIDKLIRLNTSASLEWQKRYLKKKRAVPLNMLWLLIIIAAIIGGIMVVIFLLPKYGVGI